jgi:hypothetical protein
MDTLTFTVEIIKAIVWPTVALVGLVAFRTELRKLLQRIRKGKVGSAEFEFEEAVASLRSRTSDDIAETTNPPLSLVKQADLDPRSVILNSWLVIQDKVQSIVAKHGTAEDKRDPRSVSLRVLHRILKDKPDYIDMYNDLKMLRNQAVHDATFTPRPASVIDYATLSNELAAALSPYAE